MIKYYDEKLVTLQYFSLLLSTFYIFRYIPEINETAFLQFDYLITERTQITMLYLQLI